jgi:hypothetical protein
MVRVRVLKAESLRAAAYAERGIVSDGEHPVAEVAPASPPAGSIQSASAAAHRFFVEAPLYHVQAGPVATRQEADRLLGQMTASGYRDARIVID